MENLIEEALDDICVRAFGVRFAGCPMDHVSQLRLIRALAAIDAELGPNSGARRDLVEEDLIAACGILRDMARGTHASAFRTTFPRSLADLRQILDDEIALIATPAQAGRLQGPYPDPLYALRDLAIVHILLRIRGS